jgi:hypothetical protein
MKVFGILTALFLVGCGQTSATSSLKNDSEKQVESHGGILTVFEEGSEATKLEVLTQTIGIESENRITEKTIQIDLADPNNPDLYIAEIQVDGNNMKIKEQENKFAGTGQFTQGESWEWTKWETTVVDEDDITVYSVMEVDGEELKVTQELSEGGDVLLTIKGVLKKIPNETFDERLEGL